LLIRSDRRKPVLMKTASGKSNFAGLVIIAIAAAFCLSACPHNKFGADNNDKRFFLKIGKDKDSYVDVTSQGAFDAALIKLKKNGGRHNIRFLCKEGANVQEDYDPEDPNHHELCNKTSQAAESEAADRVAAGDPNATQHVRTNSTKDLEAVLDTFVEPSPTSAPTP
jgi:hypothetical protein